MRTMTLAILSFALIVRISSEPCESQTPEAQTTHQPNNPSKPIDDSTSEPPKKVYVYERGKWIAATVRCQTVHDVLDQLGIDHAESDIIVPDLKTQLSPKTKIRVTHVEISTITKNNEIPFRTEFRHDPKLQGRSRKEMHGQPGMIEQVVRQTLHDGKAVKTEILAERKVREPVAQIVRVGRREFLPSRGLTIKRTLMVDATAYTPYPQGSRSTGRTANGMRAGYGLVAVDPRVFKLGTRLLVEGYGYALAADRGSAIKGMRIDLCVETRAEAMRFGRRKVRVHVLE